MVHLEVSSFEDRHIAGNHKQVRLESSLAFEVAEGNSHQIGRLVDGPCPTRPDIDKRNR